MQHTATRRFFGAFLLSTAALALPVAAVLFYLAPAPPAQTRRTEARVENLYRPDRGDSLSLFWVGLGEQDEARSFGLLHADPARAALTLTMLPPDSLAESEGGLRPLQEIYARDGAEAAADALSVTAGVHIHRTALTRPETLGRIADAAGPVDLVLPVELDLPGLHIDAGRQRINGLRLQAIVSAKDLPGGEGQRLALAGEVLLTLAGRYLEGFGSEQGERLFTALINALDQSSLSMADYEYRRPAWEAQTELSPTLYVPAWVDTPSGRLLSPHALEEISAAHYPR
jgi:anionic cell wall polymer biosynthesis LytR-Cps2A-Psr (LCP) family protein